MSASPPVGVTGFDRNQWQLSIGISGNLRLIGGRFRPKAVATFDRNKLTPRVIIVDKNAAYPPAFGALQQDSTLSETCRLRQCKHLNNMIE